MGSIRPNRISKTCNGRRKSRKCMRLIIFKLNFDLKAEILEGADAWELDTGASSESGHHENLMDKDKFSKLN